MNLNPTPLKSSYTAKELYMILGYSATEELRDKIVRAVNVHEELIEACRSALLRIDTDIAENPVAKTNRPEIGAQLRRAIAKAEGK